MMSNPCTKLIIVRNYWSLQAAVPKGVTKYPVQPKTWGRYCWVHSKSWAESKRDGMHPFFDVYNLQPRLKNR